MVGGGLATFGCASVIREWNAKSTVFALAFWCPTATVQAVLATVLLDLVDEHIVGGVWVLDGPCTRGMLGQCHSDRSCVFHHHRGSVVCNSQGAHRTQMVGPWW